MDQEEEVRRHRRFFEKLIERQLLFIYSEIKIKIEKNVFSGKQKLISIEIDFSSTARILKDQ